MKLTYAIAAMMITAGAAHADNPSQACTKGNAAFCGTQGPQGDPGPAGQDGRDGINGRDADTARYDAQMRGLRGQQAADRAAGALQTRTPGKGVWTGALGLSGDERGADGLSAGVRYGVTDRADIYGVVGVSDRGQVSWGIGATFILGGN